MGEEEEKVEIRLTLRPGEDAYRYFLRIKERLGLKHNSDVVRHLIKHYHDEVFGNSPQASGERLARE